MNAQTKRAMRFILKARCAKYRWNASVRPIARRKCDTAHSSTRPAENGTANTRSADAWTIQNTAGVRCFIEGDIGRSGIEGQITGFRTPGRAEGRRAQAVRYGPALLSLPLRTLPPREDRGGWRDGVPRDSRTRAGRERAATACSPATSDRRRR